MTAKTSRTGGKSSMLASRFAVKKAVMKALGTGWGDRNAFTDVDVVSQRTGAPTVVLHGFVNR
jgi:holo-[acyl-carrier protein] synthase